VEELYKDRKRAAWAAERGHPNEKDGIDMVKMTARFHSKSVNRIILDRMANVEDHYDANPENVKEYAEMTGVRPCVKYMRDEVETKRFHQAMASRRPERNAEYIEYLLATKVGPLPVIGQYCNGRFYDNTNFYRGMVDKANWYAVCTWDGWMYDRVYREYRINQPEPKPEGPQPVGKIIDGVISVIQGVNDIRNAVKPKE
jgi:hypothetical protein